MENKKWALKRVASIHVEPYLAEYISKKMQIDPKTGGVKIPYTTDLYHVVWNLMAKPDVNSVVPDDANLKIYLPCRRSSIDSLPGKDPAYFNYLSQASAKKVEASIRLMFNFEFHRTLMENEEFGRPRKNQDVVADFIQKYDLKSISQDALLKNFYRFKNHIHPKKARKYKKNGGI